ncbi:conserved hypothetical protein [delta proteobacterium NaphS2]|nr:conserved hypothetical protein [delta proteobacterium NaphS2]
MAASLNTGLYRVFYVPLIECGRFTEISGIAPRWLAAFRSGILTH